jgi:hypothetical protein
LGFVRGEGGSDHVCVATPFSLSQAADPLHIAVVEIEAGLLHRM